MPELPEVESVRRSLLPHVRDRTVASVEVRRRDVITIVGPKGGEQPLPTRNAARFLLEGARIETLERRGKQLAILGAASSDPALVVHLGMTGQFFCLEPGAHLPNPTHVHAIWKLDSGARVIFRDPRRFGGIWSLRSRTALQERWDAVGPDALTIDADDLRTRLASSRRPIKSALLDQSILAGVGNIYADESLFLARIPPTALARDLRSTHVRRLAEAIRLTLAKAIDAGGSSLADYINADGKKGSFQDAHAVYGRGGLACVACSSTLSSGQISNRTTVWCARCQRFP